MSKKNKRNQGPPRAPIVPAVQLDPAIVQQVVTWILEGNDQVTIRQGIAQQVNAKEWPPVNPDALIIAALETIHGNATHSQGLKDWSIEALKLLYKKQVEIGEFAAACKTIERINEFNNEPQGNPSPPSQVANPLPSIDPTNPRDIQLVTKAIKSGWQIPPAAMFQLPELMLNIATSSKDPRVQIAATNALMAMNGQNIKTKPLKHRHTHKVLGPITEQNFDARRDSINSRLAQLRDNAGGTPAS